MGSSVELQGQLKASKGKGQDVEFVVEQSTVLGHCDAAVSMTHLSLSLRIGQSDNV